MREISSRKVYLNTFLQFTLHVHEPQSMSFGLRSVRPGQSVGNIYCLQSRPNNLHQSRIVNCKPVLWFQSKTLHFSLFRVFNSTKELWTSIIRRRWQEQPEYSNGPIFLFLSLLAFRPSIFLSFSASLDSSA